MRGVHIGVQLGRGRTSAVHAARLATGREVALKIAHGPEHEASLWRQYAQGIGVRGPNIAAVASLERLEDGRCTLVCERVEGPTLAAQLPLPTPNRMGVALGVTRAVAQLHGLGITHGDLSANNLLLEGGLVPKLIDLGEREAHTLGYAAPEVLRGGEPSQASDLYSLGCLLYAILWGASVYAEVEPMRRSEAHLRGAPRFPASAEPRLVELVAALLEAQPELRPKAEATLEVLAELAELDPEAELRTLGLALLDGDSLLARDAVQAEITERLSALEQGAGSCLDLRGPRGSGRSALARWTSARAALLGAAVYHFEAEAASPLVALARRVAPGAEGDLVAAVSRALVSAAESRPQIVVVDRSEADPAELEAVALVLGAAARMGAVFGLICYTGPGAGSLEDFDHDARAAFVAARLPACAGAEAMLGLLDDAAITTPAGALRMLRAAIDVGALARGAGRGTLGGGPEPIAAEGGGAAHAGRGAEPAGRAQ